ncbi:MAG TPA: hypothetical protein VF026_29130 [Ktedonobacteraceae bacterium]
MQTYFFYGSSRLPALRLGDFGTMILLIGLILQSIQYWVVQ